MLPGESPRRDRVGGGSRRFPPLRGRAPLKPLPAPPAPANPLPTSAASIKPELPVSLLGPFPVVRSHHLAAATLAQRLDQTSVVTAADAGPIEAQDHFLLDGRDSHGFAHRGQRLRLP